VTGFLADVGDVDAMADAALRVLRDRELYRRMGAAARVAATTRFHPDEIVPKYLEAYARTVAGGMVGADPASTYSRSRH
jgi:glycosyltransferase involved in cell wall biosynthesis